LVQVIEVFKCTEGLWDEEAEALVLDEKV